MGTFRHIESGIKGILDVKRIEKNEKSAISGKIK